MLNCTTILSYARKNGNFYKEWQTRGKTDGVLYDKTVVCFKNGNSEGNGTFYGTAVAWRTLEKMSVFATVSCIDKNIKRK